MSMLRFSPTPTGDMTLESLWVALLNYLVAKQKGEPLLVRINDSDKSAVTEGKDSEIMQVLEKFAIIHDKVYHNSEHQHMQQSLAIRLLQEKKAFICTCIDTEGYPLKHCQDGCSQKPSQAYESLRENKTPFVLRLHKPQAPIAFQEAIQPQEAIPHTLDGEPIILNPDATPTPHFATACEDMFGDIRIIIDAHSQMSYLPEQHYMKEQLGYGLSTTYAHLPSLSHPDGSEVRLETLLKEGYIPDAIINYLLLLGHKDAPQEVFYLHDALAWFNLESISPQPITFDEERLRQLNRAHLMQMDDKRLSAIFGFADADIGKLAKLFLEEGAATIEELQAKVKPIFEEKSFIPPYDDQMREIQHILIDAPFFETYEELVSHLLAHTSLIQENLEEPLRLLLTNQKEGPELQKIYNYIKYYLLEVIS